MCFERNGVIVVVSIAICWKEQIWITIKTATDDTVRPTCNRGWYWKKESFKTIAERINRHPSTIAYEVKENRTFIQGVILVAMIVNLPDSVQCSIHADWIIILIISADFVKYTIVMIIMKPGIPPVQDLWGFWTAHEVRGRWPGGWDRYSERCQGKRET